ncbi:MAG: SRPBCC family protein [Bacteroidota bacterium]
MSKSELWKLITSLKSMQKWFFENLLTFEAKPGFETRFTVKTPNQSFVHLWKIIEVIPDQKIVYNWKYEGFSGDSEVTFQLSSKNGKTVLTLTHTVLEDFPQATSEFSRESCLAGWQWFIQKSLVEFVKKQM